MDKSAVLKEAQKYLSKGQIDKAIIELEKLVMEAPDGNMYNTIGDLYLRKGNKVSSLAYFHKAAAFFREGGFSLKALALYKKIINIAPTDVDSLVGLGELSEEKGFVTDAIRYYIAAGDILSKDKEKDRFLGIYEKILSLAPSNIHLREKVAGLFLKEGLTTHAIKELLHIANQSAKKGEKEQARDHFMKVLSIQPDNKDALSGLGSVSSEDGDLPRAVDYLRRATEAHPEDGELLKRCALLLVQTGAQEEAIGYLSRSIKLHPADISSHRLMGDIQLSRGERQKAWGSYKRAVEVLEKEPQHVKRLWESTRRFKGAMRDIGFDIGRSETPITPVMVGDSGLAKRLSSRLFELGVFALPIVYPMVAQGKARIRTIMNAALTDKDVDFAIDAFAKAGKELGVIPSRQ